MRMSQGTDEHHLDVGPLIAPSLADLLADERLREARHALENLADPEAAEVLEVLQPQRRALAFRLISRDRSPHVFTLLPPYQQRELISELSNEQLARIFNEMDPDDRIGLFEDVSEDLTSRLLALMDPAQRRETRMMMSFPEQSVGRLMTTDFLAVEPEWTLSHTLEYVRRHGREAETLDTLYVVGEGGRLIDDLPLREVLLAGPYQTVRSLLDNQFVALRAEEDREHAVRQLERYDTPVLPVVDEGGKLLGIVTFDDVADVAEEEATEDIQKLGGLEALDDPYLATGLLKLVRKRVVWLMLLFIGGMLTIAAMGSFEQQIEKKAILALFIPLIIASGGNSGSQAATILTRALAVGEVRVGDWWRIVRRELLSGLMLGIVLGTMGTGVALLAQWVVTMGAEPVSTHQMVMTGAAIGVAILGVVLFGTLIGSMLPLALKGLGLDPATSSTPFVTTIVDVTGLTIYFTTAALILGL